MHTQQQRGCSQLASVDDACRPPSYLQSEDTRSLPGSRCLVQLAPKQAMKKSETPGVKMAEKLLNCSNS